MARIPLYEEKETFAGEASRSKSLAGERISAQNIKPLVSTKYKSLGKVFNDIADDMYNVEATEQYNDATTALSQGSDNIVTDLSRNPDKSMEELMQMQKEQWNTLKETVMSRTTNRKARDLLGEALAKEEAHLYTKAQGIAYKFQIDRYVNKAKLRKKDAIQKFMNATDDKSALDALTDIYQINAGLYANRVFSKEEMDLENQEISEKLRLDKLKQFADNNPRDAYEIWNGLRKDKDGNEVQPGEIFKSLEKWQQQEMAEYAEDKYDAWLTEQERKNNKEDRIRKKIQDKNDAAYMVAWHKAENLQEGETFEFRGKTYDKFPWKQFVNDAEDGNVSKTTFDTLALREEKEEGAGKAINNPLTVKRIDDMIKADSPYADVEAEVMKALKAKNLTNEKAGKMLVEAVDAPRKKWYKRLMIWFPKKLDIDEIGLEANRRRAEAEVMWDSMEAYPPEFTYNYIREKLSSMEKGDTKPAMWQGTDDYFDMDAIAATERVLREELQAWRDSDRKQNVGISEDDYRKEMKKLYELRRTAEDYGAQLKAHEEAIKKEREKKQ